MSKITNPQIYVFNNRKIADSLSENYIVDEGNLGYKIVASYPDREKEYYLNPRYGWHNNLHEYNVWIFDFQNELAPKSISQSDRPVGQNLMIKIEYPETTMNEAPFALAQMSNMLDDNKIRIVFAGAQYEEKHYIYRSTGKNRYVCVDCVNLGPYSTFGSVPYPQHGKKFKVEESAFSELLSKYVDGYDVVFKLPEFYDPSLGKRAIDSNYSVLAKSDDGKVISYIGYQKDKGYELILPLCHDREVVAEKILTEIMPRVLPDIVPESKLFSWINDDCFKAPQEIEIEKQKEILLEDYLKEKKNLDNRIKEIKQANKFLTDILTETGDNLVAAVCKYMKWLGFISVEEIDGTEEIKREDIQICDGNDLYIIEVKGIGGTSTDAECAQVGKHRRRREKENRDKDIYPLYIVNHQRYISPWNRENPPFSKDQIDYAIVDERGLLTTWQLYQQYHLIEKGIFTKDETRMALKESGLISLIPPNVKLVGTVTEYFKKPKASILTISQDIKRNDELLCFKDGAWIKGTVQSIQLNDSPVENASHGEIGLVMDVELAVGYKLYKRF